MQAYKLVKETFWIVIGQAAAVIGTLVSVKILTGLLSPAVYGELAIGLTIAIVVNQVILGPICNGISRFYTVAAEQGEVNVYLTESIEIIKIANKVIFGIVLLLILFLPLSNWNRWLILAIISIVFSVVSGYNNILSGIQNAARRRAIVALHQGAEPWAKTIIAAGLVFWLGPSSTVSMIGYVIATTIITISQCIFIRRVESINSKRSIEKKWTKSIFNYSLPFAYWGIFTWAQLASDRWALSVFSSIEQVGMYAVLLQLGYYPMTVAAGMAVQLLSPIIYERAGNASDDSRLMSVNKMSSQVILIMFIIICVSYVACIFLKERIITIFASPEYISVAPMLPWMILSGGIFAVSQFISLNIMSQMKTNKMVKIKIICSLLGVAFNFIGAYYLGLEGVVFANVLFSSMLFFWMLVTLRAINKSRTNGRDIYFQSIT